MRGLSTLLAARRAGRPGWWRGEDGAGTTFFLFCIVICLMISGLSVDVGNAWRQRELLSLSADVAAHAGASVIAREGEKMAIVAAAVGASKLNTPTETYGRVIYDPYSDVEALHYDPGTNMLSMAGPINAVSVHLQRSARVQNPVPTFLLKFIGQNAWDINVVSVAAVIPTTRCDSGDGIYAHQGIAMGGEAFVGAGVCVHSQKGVDLQKRSTFAAGSGLSMPDFSDCNGNCNDMTSPGIGAASAETNLIMVDPAEHIDTLSAAFINGNETLPEETEFFAARSLAEDLSALDELGVDTSELVLGDVVRLNQDLFSRARELPAGLVYDITCEGPEGSPTVLTIGGRAADPDIEDDPDADTTVPEDFIEDFDAGGEPLVEPEATDDAAPVLEDLVLVTDCLLHFTEKAQVQGSVIFSTRAAKGIALTADEGASVGDPKLTCKPALQSAIMAKGGMSVPASFTASNVSFLMAGDIAIAGNPEGVPALHRGTSLHSGGRVQLEGDQSFQACGTGLDMVLPKLNVIKYVIPTDPLVGTN